MQHENILNDDQGAKLDNTQPPEKVAENLRSYSENMRITAELNLQRDALRARGQLAELHMRTPRNILKRATPQPFQFDEVPQPIARFAYEVSQATGFDHSGLIHSAVSAAAAIIDDRYQLEARRGWPVSARIWGVLIASSAAGKTPTIRFSTNPIKHIHAAEVARWQKNIKEKDIPPNEREGVPARYTSDATIAALSERLKDNPRGILMLTEEFSSWIGGIDSSNKGEAAQNKGAWLQLRDGGPQQIDRINRGPITIENWGASVLAACTPDGLAKQMKEMPEDGLIQRFIPCIMRNPDLDAPERNLDPTQAIETWAACLRWADQVTERQVPQICLRFDPEAQAIFNAENKAIRQLQQSTEDVSTAYASHLGKHPGMLAEICIVFHVFSSKGAVPRDLIDADTVQTAIRYMRRVRKHSAHLYSAILSSSPAFDLARGLARSIVAADEVLTTVGRDWMTQHCQGFKKADDRVRREAVQVLIDADWLEAPAWAGSYGGWPTKYEVNDQVFRLFAEYGEEWRKRREAVRDMIGDSGD